MSHVRTQIRESIAALVTGLASTGPRVFQSRMRPQGEANLPCLLVTTNDEEVDATVDGVLNRNLTLAIRGIAMVGTGLDDTLDQIALEVETAMASQWRATFERLEIDFDDELEKPVGSVTLNYRIQYFTAADNPAVMI